MKREYLKVGKIPNKYHIILPEEHVHIVNRAASPSNIFYIVPKRKSFMRLVQRDSKSGKVLCLKNLFKG